MWEIQRINRRNSALLVCAIGTLMILVGVGIGLASAPDEQGAMLGGGIALGLWAVMSAGTYFAGDKIMLSLSGAAPASRDTNQQLFNVVEEMCIASGMPMPKVYIINDTAPNAFATGRRPESSAIVVTRGLLMKLNRAELQAVIAHEMSHIRNRDVLYMMMTGIMIGVIVLLCDFFMRGSRRMGYRRSGGGGKNAAGAQVAMMVFMLLFAILAPVFARILFFAVSRRREYLADACAAELTRYPDALADALEKIAGDREVLEVANRATAALYIHNPIKKFEARAQSLLSTHPPVEERIKILRAMGRGGDASFLAYNNCYKQLSSYKAKTIVPPAVAQKAKQKVPILDAVERLQQPVKTQAQQIERLRDLQNLVVGVTGAGRIACACGFSYLVDQFQKLKSLHEETTGQSPGVVSCKACGSPVADPADAVALRSEERKVFQDLEQKNAEETREHTRFLDLYKHAPQD